MVRFKKIVHKQLDYLYEHHNGFRDEWNSLSRHEEHKMVNELTKILKQEFN